MSATPVSAPGKEWMRRRAAATPAPRTDGRATTEGRPETGPECVRAEPLWSTPAWGGGRSTPAWNRRPWPVPVGAATTQTPNVLVIKDMRGPERYAR